MTLADVLITIGAVCAVGAIAGLILVPIFSNNDASLAPVGADPVYDAEPVEHHGWEDDTTVLDQITEETRAELAAAAAEVPGELAVYRSSHHEDTVEIKPSDWMPIIGARRNALLVTDTQQFAAVPA